MTSENWVMSILGIIGASALASFGTAKIRAKSFLKKEDFEEYKKGQERECDLTHEIVATKLAAAHTEAGLVQKEIGKNIRDIKQALDYQNGLIADIFGKINSSNDRLTRIETKMDIK